MTDCLETAWKSRVTKKCAKTSEYDKITWLYILIRSLKNWNQSQKDVCLKKAYFFGYKTLRLFYKIIFCLQNIRTLKNQPLHITTSRDKLGDQIAPVLWGLRWHFGVLWASPPKKRAYRGEEGRKPQNICIPILRPPP